MVMVPDENSDNVDRVLAIDNVTYDQNFREEFEKQLLYNDPVSFHN